MPASSPAQRCFVEVVQEKTHDAQIVPLRAAFGRPLQRVPTQHDGRPLEPPQGLFGVALDHGFTVEQAEFDTRPGWPQAAGQPQDETAVAAAEFDDSPRLAGETQPAPARPRNIAMDRMA